MPDLEHPDDTLDVKDAAPSSDATEQDVTPAEDDGSEQTMAEAVAEALKGEGESSDPESETANDEEAGEPAPEAQADGQTDGEDSPPSEDVLPPGDPTDEEMENYSRKATARIRDLVSQRNQAQETVNRVQPFLDFVQKNDIPGQDLDVMLDLTAKLRHGDFAGFLQGITPYINLAQQYTGQVLPPDLQQQVKQGYVSPEIAKELAQRRAQVQVGEQNLRTQQNQNAQQQAEHSAQKVHAAITQWEQKTKQSDPDYGLKADMIRRTSQALMQEHGNPRTPEQAIQLVSAAYEEVNKQTAGFRPAPKPTTPSPRSTSQTGGTAPTAEPKSMMDAAVQALNAHRA